MTGDAGPPLFSRSELLAGLPARRVTTLLFAIEARTARLVDRSRAAMATYETERSVQERELAFLQALAGARDLPVRVTVQDLERYAPSWADLVPPDPDLRAALVRRLGEKYPLVAGRASRVAAALGTGDPAVRSAYERAYGAVIDHSFAAPQPVRDRLRWLRARAAERLETLPPFWMAFALALTETIAEGILAIPVAVAGIGPLPGIALLVVLGLVNVVTLAALVEAITRTGQMRYGETYFGRLVREYLGRGGAVAFTVTLFVFNAVVLLTYLLGFASVLSDASGIGLLWWVGLLFAINVYFLRRDALDATVASALVIGAVNIALILAICAIGLAYLDPANLAIDASGGGLVLEVGLLQIVFGVILVAYFGHTSAGNAAKLLLREDMTGKALLGGNVAAMLAVIGLYSLGVLAVNGAVGSEALVGFEGTAISPLAEVAGPVVLVLGSIYVVLALGIGSIYCSLGLFNQVREWLPPVSRAAGVGQPAWQRAIAGRRGRSTVSLLPVVAVVLILVVLILADVADFTAPLAVVGILAVPLMAGVYPMLLVAASRRRGEFVPRPVIGFIGHPLVVTTVAALFIAAILVHGIWIWTDPVARVAALGAAAGVAVVAVRAVSGGAFRPRAVVQLRVEGPGAGTAALEVVRTGRPAAARVTWRSGAMARSADGATVVLGSAGGLADVRVELEPRVAGAIRVWAYRVDAEGDSSAWADAAVVETPGPAVPVTLDGTGTADLDLHEGADAVRIGGPA